MNIEMTPCKSSQVESYGYDPATKTLALRFKNAKSGFSLYHYFDVPLSEFDGLKCCASVGTFLGTRIRGKFKYQRISADGLGQIVDHRKEAA